MLTIENNPAGYTFRSGDPGGNCGGFTRQIPDLAALHVAIDHYYGQPHSRAGCPLCPHTGSARGLQPESIG